MYSGVKPENGGEAEERGQNGKIIDGEALLATFTRF